MVLATAVASVTGAIQVSGGIVAFAQHRAFWISVLAPYVAILTVHILWRLTIAPWQVDEARRQEIQELRGQKSSVEEKLAAILRGPKFDGHFYQFQIISRSPLDHEIVQHILDRECDRRGVARERHRFSCDLFVEAFITNIALGKSKVIEYALEIEIAGETKRLPQEPSFGGWTLECKSNKLNPRMLQFETHTKNETIPDLSSLITSPPLQQGDSEVGWLHFVLHDINEVEFKRTARNRLALIVTDGLGVEHPIDKDWIGPTRPCKITADFS